MAIRRKVRSGVRSAILFLKRQIMWHQKAIKDSRILIVRLKRADKRVHRLEVEKHVSRRTRSARSTGNIKGVRGGPNIREVAFQILSGRKKPMNLADLAARVVAKKGHKPGDNFTMNLGAALKRDKRFKRISRGVYGLSGIAK